MKKRVLLGVNIDHVATLRQARKTSYPDPLFAALQAEQAGADGITLHLREDRRHIQDWDVRRFRESLQSRMNLEIAVTPEMIGFALEIMPEHVCLVPEKREELTTEGGLDVVGQQDRVREACDRLGEAGIDVSLFIDPDFAQIEASLRAGAPTVELHTGRYAEAESDLERGDELNLIRSSAEYAHSAGLTVNAGHGLHYRNVQPIAAIAGMNELNIGHSIIAQAIFSGMTDAVREMRQLIDTAL